MLHPFIGKTDLNPKTAIEKFFQNGKPGLGRFASCVATSTRNAVFGLNPPPMQKSKISPVKKQCSLKDIARQAGCAVSVVSMVVNKANNGVRVSDKKRREIERICRQLDYKANYHAQALRSGRSNVQAVLFDDGSFNAGIFVDILAGIKACARLLDNDLLIVGKGVAGDEVERGKQLLKNRQVDSLILLGTPYARRIPELSGTSQPVVIAGGPLEPAPFPRLYADAAPGIHEAVRQLAALGHTRILWVGCVTAGRLLVPDRREAFEAATSELNLRGEEIALTVDRPFSPSGQNEMIAGCKEQFSRYLGSHRPPTAVMAFNEPMGIGIYAALQERGLRIPDDVSVVGYDGHYANFAHPSMSVVSMETHEMGRRASDLAFRMTLDRKLIAEKAGYVERVPSRFLPGDSIAPARSTAVARRPRIKPGRIPGRARSSHKHAS